MWRESILHLREGSGIPKHRKGPHGTSVPGVSEGVAEKGRCGWPGNAQQKTGTVKPSPLGSPGEEEEFS